MWHIVKQFTKEIQIVNMRSGQHQMSIQVNCIRTLNTVGIQFNMETLQDLRDSVFVSTSFVSLLLTLPFIGIYGVFVGLHMMFVLNYTKVFARPKYWRCLPFVQGYGHGTINPVTGELVSTKHLLEAARHH
jgi:hypothetical protein